MACAKSWSAKSLAASPDDGGVGDVAYIHARKRWLTSGAGGAGTRRADADDGTGDATVVGVVDTSGMIGVVGIFWGERC